MKLLFFGLELCIEELYHLLLSEVGVECCFVIVILSSQLEHNVTLWASPPGMFLFYTKVYRVFMPLHVSLFTKGLLAHVTRPSLQFHVQCIFVSL